MGLTRCYKTEVFFTFIIQTHLVSYLLMSIVAIASLVAIHLSLLQILHFSTMKYIVGFTAFHIQYLNIFARLTREHCFGLLFCRLSLKMQENASFCARSGSACFLPNWCELLDGSPLPLEMCGLTISATRPVPVVDDACLPTPVPDPRQRFYPILHWEGRLPKSHI